MPTEVEKAAPDLLAALTALVEAEELAREVFGGAEIDALEAALTNAYAAIAKAKGK